MQCKYNRVQLLSEAGRNTTKVKATIAASGISIKEISKLSFYDEGYQKLQQID